MKLHQQSPGRLAGFRGSFFILAVVLVTVSLFTRPLETSAEVASGCAVGSRCIYIPFVNRSAPALDLVIRGVEVNQAIQNETNTVPLVAGRSAVLRIFAQASGTDKPVTGISVAVTAQQSGRALSNPSSLVSATVPLSYSRGDYLSTINIPLPAAWLSGTIDLTVTLDPENRQPEADESNNAFTQRLTFAQMPALNITIVPVQYTHQTTASSAIYPAPVKDTFSDWIRRTYPVSLVNVQWHAPYAFTGNLSTSEDWGRLLREISALKSSEGAPDSQVYYGFVPVTDGFKRWFYGGIAGIGWVGLRASVGLDLPGSAAQIAAHEVGHNLGMSHTPCGVSSYDGNYPYKDGSIGQYGLDVATGTLYIPETNKDMMSYCNPKWISDYTYRVLYDSQVNVLQSQTMQLLSPDAQTAQRQLLVRVTIDESGVTMLPIYVMEGPASSLIAQDNTATVQAVGASGEVLAEYAVQRYAIEMEGLELSGVHAVLPAPEQPVAQVRLLIDGEVAAAQNLEVASTEVNPRVTMDTSKNAASVHWDSPDQPVLVRYSPDGGYRWTTLSVDALGGMETYREAQLAGGQGIFEIIPANTWR